MMVTNTESSLAIAEEQSQYRRWRRPPVITRRPAPEQSAESNAEGAEKAPPSSQEAGELMSSQTEKGAEILRQRRHRTAEIIEENQRRRTHKPAKPS